MKYIWIFLFAWTSSMTLRAQDQVHLIQFSGLVLTSDSLVALPYTTVFVKELGRGTSTNMEGFFSIIVQPGDTIVFSSVGYKTAVYAVPEDLQESRYSIIQLMTRDTIHLQETVVYPWPSPRQFKEAFLSLNIPDDQYEIARKNLEQERIREMSRTLPRDANEIVDFYARQQAASYYYYGQIPPMNIFNPIAWAEFFKAWKNGKFRKP